MSSSANRNMVFSIDLIAPAKTLVAPKELQQYVKGVESDAGKVCSGLVDELAKLHVKASSKKVTGPDGSVYWLLQVGTALSEQTLQLMAAPEALPAVGDGEDEDSRPVTNIQIQANTADLPPLVNALNNFFSGRAVFGLVFTVVSITATALGYQMLVRRGGNH